jgi:outer membrane protein assembly factor BamB
MAYTGFSDGSVAALRLASGTVAWRSSLAAGKDAFVDVDVTPVSDGTSLYAASSAGGLFALDQGSGDIQWRVSIDNVGGIALDKERLFAVAADEGVHALDKQGRVLWRQGSAGDGEPTIPLIADDYLMVSMSQGGLFVTDKNTGRLLQYFDPGYGISAKPLWTGSRIYVLSNSAILYALNVH